MNWRRLIGPLGALLFTLLAACSGNSAVQVASAKSPNNRAEAILAETNGGATTSFGYEVSLRAASEQGDSVQVASLYGATRNEQAFGVNLVWLNDQTLEIQYLKAKSAKINQANTSIGGQLITVRFRSGVLDKAARPGGMEYNLRRK